MSGFNLILAEVIAYVHWLCSICKAVKIAKTEWETSDEIK